MRQINTGNILPFYAADSHISDLYFNSSQKHNVKGTYALLPFQLILQTTNTYRFEVVEFGNVAVLAVLTVTERTTPDGFKIYTYTAPSSIAGVQDCEEYQIRVIDDGSDVTVYMSERIYVRALWKNQINFTNATDLGGVMYQTGYTQRLYFDGFEDTPEIDKQIEIQSNLSGIENVTSSKVTEKRTFVVMNLLDSQLTACNSIEQHATINFVEVSTNKITSIKRITFESEQLENKANKGTFIFTTQTIYNAGCGVNSFTLNP